jgi:putative DNA primase/helicase
MSIDFASIAQAALRSAESLLRELFPKGHREGREFCIGDLNGAEGDSLKVNLDTGVWNDFATGENGGADLISLWSRVRGCKNSDAAREIAERVAVNLKQDNRRSRETRYQIRDVDGTLVAIHLRLDIGGKKKLWWSRPDGKKGLGDLKVVELPLYGAESLCDLEDGGTIVVTEGEKAAGALLARGISAVGTVTGAGSIPNDNSLAILSRFRVVLWADNDSPGVEHMLRIARALRRLGHLNVRLVQWSEAPEKGDAADFSGGQDHLERLIRCAVDLAEIRPPRFSDDALAAQFAERFASSLRYIGRLGRWFEYCRTAWLEDDTLRAFDLSRTICREAASEVAEDRKKLAMAIASAKTVAAVERLARSDRRLGGTIDQWDADLMLLNTPNGAVDLGSGHVRSNRRDDYCTKVTAVGPADFADCPLWLSFLDRIFVGDDNLIAYMKRLFGYMLTGSTIEQQFCFFFGVGANGKGVLTNTLLGILGSYAKTTASETFMASKFERHLTEVANLRGARLVVASETEKGLSLGRVPTQGDDGRHPHQRALHATGSFRVHPSIQVGNRRKP